MSDKDWSGWCVWCSYTAKYPVIMVPGFVTTGLEVWEGEACAQKYFR